MLAKQPDALVEHVAEREDAAVADMKRTHGRAPLVLRRYQHRFVRVKVTDGESGNDDEPPRTFF